MNAQPSHEDQARKKYEDYCKSIDTKPASRDEWRKVTDGLSGLHGLAGEKRGNRDGCA